MIGIYKITSPKKKIYIGQSINIEKRWDKYKNLQCESQIKLYRSFLKYGIEKHKFEIIILCELEKLNELEKYYINKFDTFNTNKGLNLTSGGDNKIVSEETRKKISESKKGKKHTDKTKEKCRQASLGRKHSEDTKNKMSNSQKKIILNIETGIYYFGLEEASKYNSITKSKLGKYLRGTINNITNLMYV